MPHDMDGYSMEEVAALQGARLPAIKSCVARGRARLRRHYERLFLLKAREDEAHADHEQAG